MQWSISPLTLGRNTDLPPGKTKFNRFIISFGAKSILFCYFIDYYRISIFSRRCSSTHFFIIYTKQIRCDDCFWQLLIYRTVYMPQFHINKNAIFLLIFALHPFESYHSVGGSNLLKKWLILVVGGNLIHVIRDHLTSNAGSLSSGCRKR